MNKLELIILRSSKRYLESHVDKYLAKMNDTVKRWKEDMRVLLSVPYMKGVRNNSLYPRMRSGMLRNSIIPPKFHLRKFEFGKVSKAYVVGTVKYKRLKGNKIDDYGDYLNEQLASYGGYRELMESNLALRIMTRVRNTITR